MQEKYTERSFELWDGYCRCREILAFPCVLQLLVILFFSFPLYMSVSWSEPDFFTGIVRVQHLLGHDITSLSPVFQTCGSIQRQKSSIFKWYRPCIGVNGR